MDKDNAIYTGNLCTLRPLRPEDAESLARHANDIRIWNNVRDLFPHPYKRTDADAFIAMASGKSPVQDFAIVVEGEAVGCVGYVPGTDVERVSAEVGYWLGEAYRGRGIMNEAAGIRHLLAPVFSHNAASMRVLEKAGFRKAGVLHNAAVKNGRLIDLHLYELTK